MPKGNPTTLFISSTCYDLSQVRVDLADFARTLGLEPVMSESDSFPIDPDDDTVTNCLNNVKTKADIFLLVVGGRYGSINDTGKSITNLEFLEASARGIPRYVFIKKDIITLLPIWKDNPDADFSRAVDTPKLFEFVANLRESGELWVFPFEAAQDIVATMRKQLSYLLSDCLDLRSKFKSVDRDTLSLSPGTLKIYLEKPSGWEYKAFAQALEDSMARYRTKRLDYELGINFGLVIEFADKYELKDWISAKVKQISHLLELLCKTVNDGLELAVGPVGLSGDISRIRHLAERVSDAYSELLDWSLEFDRIRKVDVWLPVIFHARALLNLPIFQLEEFSSTLSQKIEEALLATNVEHSLTLQLNLGDSKAMIEEMRKLF